MSKTDSGLHRQGPPTASTQAETRSLHSPAQSCRAEDNYTTTSERPTTLTRSNSDLCVLTDSKRLTGKYSTKGPLGHSDIIPWLHFQAGLRVPRQ